jgi:predicted nucleic-acid-binding protein
VIGLDTNVLLRWLIPDLESNLGSSEAEIERVSRTLQAEGARFFVNPIVIAETAWVLERTLKLARPDVSQVVSSLLYAENITVGNDAEVRAAQSEFEQSNAGLADCLIAQLNLAAACTHTLTFDQRASRTAGFRHVDEHGSI